MNAMIRYWNDKYGVFPNLETDAPIRSLLNKHVVAAFMNRFPRTATGVFAQSNGELARLLFTEREGGSFRVLRAMYQFEDGGNRGDLINRLLMQSPAVKAARNRRKIAQRMLKRSLDDLPADHPIFVLAIGGGDGRLEAEVIACLKRHDVYYCGVDRDPRAVDANREVLKQHGLEDRGCTVVGGIYEASDVEAAVAFTEQQCNVRFDGVGVCVCQGVAEYLDIDSSTNRTLSGMLSAVRTSLCKDGRLMISHTDYHDRVEFLEKGLQWHMRLRNRDELAAVVEQAGWKISVCEHEPMKLITMCLAENLDNGER